MKLVLVQPQLEHDEAADNIAAVRDVLEEGRPSLGEQDVVLLPEHVDATHSKDDYVDHVGALARELGCWVVGGSHHQSRGDGAVNAGAVIAPDGTVAGHYQKLRPYASERTAVRPGAVYGALRVAGRRVLILICADFWFADLFERAAHLPDVVLVPALSVTRKATPDYSRALWRHMAVARAFEYGTYVGISDWGYPSKLPAQFTCGVGGFADPTKVDPEELYLSIGDSEMAVHDLDFEVLARFRQDRIERGFFWRRP